jgi:hypothetical protein
MKKLLFFLLFLSFLFPKNTYADSVSYSCQGKVNTNISVDKSIITNVGDKTTVSFTVTEGLAEDQTYYLDSLEWEETEHKTYTGSPLVFSRTFSSWDFNDSKLKLMLSVDNDFDQSLCTTTEKIAIDNNVMESVKDVIESVSRTKPGECNVSINKQTDINSPIDILITDLDPGTNYVVNLKNGLTTTSINQDANSKGKIAATFDSPGKIGTYDLTVIAPNSGIGAVCSNSDILEISLTSPKAEEGGKSGSDATLPEPTCTPSTGGEGIDTAIGCLPTDPGDFTNLLLTRGISIAAGLALMLMIFGAFSLITSAGNPDAVKKGKEVITSALIGLLFIVFSVFLLKLIGVDILKIPTLTSSINQDARPGGAWPLI